MIWYFKREVPTYRSELYECVCARARLCVCVCVCAFVNCYLWATVKLACFPGTGPSPPRLYVSVANCAPAPIALLITTLAVEIATRFEAVRFRFSMTIPTGTSQLPQIHQNITCWRSRLWLLVRIWEEFRGARTRVTESSYTELFTFDTAVLWVQWPDGDPFWPSCTRNTGKHSLHVITTDVFIVKLKGVF